jgi:hypothetical protein
MAVWTPERIALLRHRARELRWLVDASDPHTHPELLAAQARQWAAAQNQGLDAGYDPTYDAQHDPHRDPRVDNGPEA